MEEYLERKNQKVVVSITPGPIETKYSQETSCFSFLKFYRNVLLVCISLALAGLAGGISFAPIMPDLIRTARYAFFCYSWWKWNLYVLNRINNWLVDIKLAIDMTKTEFVLIGFRKKCQKLRLKVPNITINEIPVKQVSSAKSPDLTIDKKLVRVSRK